MIQLSYSWVFLFKEHENIISKNNMYPYDHCGIIYNIQDMETT